MNTDKIATIATIAKLLEGTEKIAGSENTDIEFITIKDACKIAKVQRWKISEWLMLKDENGRPLIRSFKIGSSKNSRVRIDKASFISFLESKIRQAEDGKEVEE